MHKKVIKKICLLGDNAVGKTSLIKKYVFDTFDDKYIATIGTKTVKKELEVDYFGKPLHLTLMIWDIIGQKEYRNLQSMSFEGTSGAMMVCDSTRPETLHNLESYWIPSLRKVAGNVPMIFLANKCDLQDEVKLTSEDAQGVSDKYSNNFYMTSAKTGENVEDAFIDIGGLVVVGKTDTDVQLKQVEKKHSPAEVLDNIISHFCHEFKQDTDYSMSVIRKQCEVVGLDITNPTKKSMLELINRLAIIESDVLSTYEINKNKTERMAFLARM